VELLGASQARNELRTEGLVESPSGSQPSQTWWRTSGTHPPPPASARVTMLWRSASVWHARMLGIVRISQRFAGGIASANGFEAAGGWAQPMGHSPHDRRGGAVSAPLEDRVEARVAGAEWIRETRNREAVREERLAVVANLTLSPSRRRVKHLLLQSIGVASPALPTALGNPWRRRRLARRRS
jgi:hypothetical protein